MRQISVVVTDLDNTLFDWFEIWYGPFAAMLDRLSADSGVPREVLIREFKEVYSRYGTTEYAFAIEELPSLRSKHPGEDLATVYREAIHAHRSARKPLLHAYADVEEALQTLKDKGVLLVGYTESQAFYTHMRLKRMGLDRLLDYIYSPPDHELPGNRPPESFRKLSPEQYELRRTVIRHLPAGEKKPNPRVLLDIISQVGATPDECVYIGDNLMKDIAMAQSAKIEDVWAKYGESHGRPGYDLLRQVTHWSSADVAREKATTNTVVTPTHTLTTGFSEVLQKFLFVPFVRKDSDSLKQAVDIWKQAVAVQMHFNDLEMRVRNYALTIVTAILAGAGLSIKEAVVVAVKGITIPLASILFGGGALICCAFYLMDRLWYHRLLVGAVNQALFIEKRYQPVCPELGLTGSIGKASPVELCCWKIRSATKIDLFYGLGVLLMAVSCVLALFAEVKKPDPDPKDKLQSLHSRNLP
jgi:FMN phosphatase YigB (HAD superfamily)